MAATSNPVIEQQDFIIRRPINQEEIIPQRPLIAPRVENVGRRKGRLSLQQYRFCCNFLQGMKPYKAALEAGYSESTAQRANELLLENPAIVRELNRRSANWFKQQEVTAERIISEASKMAFWNILDFAEIDESGKLRVDLKRLTRNAAAAITELRYDQNGNPVIKFSDKKANLEFLARIKKYLSESKDPSSPESDDLTITKLDAIIQQNTNITINNFNINATDRNVARQVIDSDELLLTEATESSSR